MATVLLVDDEPNIRWTLGEFLRLQARSYKAPLLRRKALLHGHCHQKAVIGMDCEQQVLKAMGLDLEVLESGCCGMAGSFGFEPGATHDVSIKCGERVLLPAVRKARDEDLIIADGFSCKTQIEQGTDRRALHLARVLQLALREGEQGVKGETSRGHVPARADHRTAQSQYPSGSLNRSARSRGFPQLGFVQAQA